MDFTSDISFAGAPGRTSDGGRCGASLPFGADMNDVVIITVIVDHETVTAIAGFFIVIFAVTAFGRRALEIFIRIVFIARRAQIVQLAGFFLANDLWHNVAVIVTGRDSFVANA